MKKIISLLLILIVLMSSMVFAGSSLTDSITVNGKKLIVKEVDGQAVYGSPSDVVINKSYLPAQEQKNGQWRYLGYDMNGNIFHNEKFPNDATSGRATWDNDWVKEPWRNDLCVTSKYSQDPSVLTWMNNIKSKYNWGSYTASDLKNYLLIQSPQSEYTAGVFTGWNIGRGNKITYYETFTTSPLLKYSDEPILEIPTDTIPGGVNIEYAIIYGDKLKDYSQHEQTYFELPTGKYDFYIFIAANQNTAKSIFPEYGTYYIPADGEILKTEFTYNMEDRYRTSTGNKYTSTTYTVTKQIELTKNKPYALIPISFEKANLNNYKVFSCSESVENVHINRYFGGTLYGVSLGPNGFTERDQWSNWMPWELLKKEKGIIRDRVNAINEWY